ncbi:MAG: glycine cleavage system protein GcvH [Desulfuromonadia bacterium]
MENTWYTKEHEWIRVTGTRGVVGITGHAAHELGDVTFVELPPVGKTVSQFDILASIESVKAASDIYAPLSGRVVSVNEALNSHPEIVNESPEGEGWICEIEITDPGGTGNLMTREGYGEYLRNLS